MAKKTQKTKDATNSRATPVSIAKLTLALTEVQRLGATIEQALELARASEFNGDLQIVGGNQIDDALSVAFSWIRNCQKHLDDVTIRGKYKPDLATGATTKLRILLGKRERRSSTSE